MEGVALRKESVPAGEAVESWKTAAILRDARKAVEEGTLSREDFIGFQDRIAQGEIDAIAELERLVRGDTLDQSKGSDDRIPAEQGVESPTSILGRSRLGFRPQISTSDRGVVDLKTVTVTTAPEEEPKTTAQPEQQESGSALQRRVEDIHSQLANTVNILSLLGKKEYQSYIETYKEATAYFGRSDLTPGEREDFSRIVFNLEEKAAEIAGSPIAANQNKDSSSGKEGVRVEPTDISKTMPEPEERAVPSFDEMPPARKNHDIRRADEVATPPQGNVEGVSQDTKMGTDSIVETIGERKVDPEVKEELDTLLRDWFGTTGGIFRRGESGLRHPAYLALRDIKMGDVLQNDLPEDVRPKVKSKLVKDVMRDIKKHSANWQEHLGIKAVPEETFHEYLERVVRANLKQYGSTE